MSVTELSDSEETPSEGRPAVAMPRSAIRTEYEPLCAFLGSASSAVDALAGAIDYALPGFAPTIGNWR